MTQNKSFKKKITNIPKPKGYNRRSNRGVSLKIILLSIAIIFIGTNVFGQATSTTQCQTKRCRDRQQETETEKFIKNISDGLDAGLSENRTRDEMNNILDRIESSVEYARSQVRRYSRHQQWGINRRRVRLRREWSAKKVQLLELQENVLQEVENFDDQTLTNASQNDFPGRLQNVQTELASTRAEIAQLDAQGVESIDLSAEELRGLSSAGSGSGGAGSGTSAEGGGSGDAADAAAGNASGASGVSDGESTGSAAIEEGDSSFSSGGGGGAGIASGGSGGAGDGTGNSSDFSSANLLSTQEANGLQRNFLGDPIGLARADLFGIVSNKYKEKDKKKTFYQGER